MIFLVLGMLLWTATYQQAASHLRVEKALRVRTERADRLKQAMAWSLALLETGKPSIGMGGTYHCRMILDGNTYVAIFTRTDTDVFEVVVRPRADAYEDLWPLAPESFGGE
jgi:hypothetical protein